MAMTDQTQDTSAENRPDTAAEQRQDDGPAEQTGEQRAAASANAESVSEAPTLAPPTDIFETKDALIMMLDMPGADPESLNVALDRQELRVSARSTPSVPEGYTLMHAEYRDGNYERVFSISERIDDERIEAVFKDGCLRLTLPKATPATKRIEVKAA
jgi:HSP20 family molecular chaperone IbpA